MVFFFKFISSRVTKYRVYILSTQSEESQQESHARPGIDVPQGHLLWV